MPATQHKPVLIIGGSGVVGARAARTLRRLQPELPITIGGRDLGRAEAVAREIGGADAAAIDLDRPDLGQPGREFGAVAVFVKDATLNSLRAAQARGVPYVSTSSGVFEIGPEVAQAIHRPTAPVLLASHWLAGAAVFPALHFGRAYRRIDEIRIGVLLDEQDMGGPAAAADYDRIVGATSRVQVLQDGQWRWIGGEDAAAPYRSVDGVVLPAQAYSPMDVVSLAAATGARWIRLDLAYAQSASRRRGEPFSTEIAIEMAGERPDGTAGRSRHELVHPEGQAPLTALGIASAVERLLGLAGGGPVAPGLHLPETLLDPAEMVRRLEAFGTRIREVPPAD
ncbi:saccharopine dehydrogenase [Inquilinus limosus]|uniref:Saccharopine dehydrogenase n=1 Tax=Inquilinus limosus TaxID=171674 RepID=A0A211Z050_9PROT|nr:saccharopine dehydrogenase [Inquilinus limosus]OWJ58620.1 saccharopine dehydrogenase [Inquilinus limosus]